MKKSLLALVLTASVVSCNVFADDLFSAVGGLIDTGSKMVKTVTGDEEKSDQEALAQRRATKADTSSLTASEKQLVKICDEYRKNPVMTKKKYLGSEVSAHGEYSVADDSLFPVQFVKFSFYDGVKNAEYLLSSSDNKLVHPEWNNGETHSLSGKLESIKDKLTGCTFHITNVH